MTVHRRPQLPGVRRLARALAVTAAATTALGVTVAGSAQALPGPPAEPIAKKDVKAQVDQLYDEAEQASERYNAAQECQRRLQTEAAALQSQIAGGQEELNRLRQDLGALAGAQYRSGVMNPGCG